MFTMDVPYVPAQETPIVLAQANATGATTQPDYLLKICKEYEEDADPESALHGIYPAGWLQTYYGQHDRVIDAVAVKASLLETTKHGKLEQRTVPNGAIYYMYYSEPGFVGDDQASFMAEFEGKRYKIVVNIRVLEYIDDNNPKCFDPQLIKVTKPSSGASGYGSGYDLSSVIVTFDDLPGGAIGQTVGSTITLDTNAAGHNWFIDATPWDNSEYLPTSNPNEWVAKEGSDAYGKMDMLSVLLHEYGHALGIEHSADNHDYMATTLTAGVRRLPSAEEMALMQQLVAQIKGEVTTALSPSPSPASGRGWPAGSGEGGGLPLPIPLGAGFGIAFMGRLRGSRYGDVSIAPDYATLTAKYAVAANATFANLDSPAGWNSQGSVDIAPSTIDPLTGSPSTGSGRTASVTLNEVSTSQTRLSQVFMLGEQDRYLSFTLSGAALDDLNGAPDVEAPH